MKKIYYLLAILTCIYSNAQINNLGGTPVDGVTPIMRADLNKIIPSVKIPTTTTTTRLPTGNSSEVGITEGELSVSLSGGANYSIPITLPTGINNVVPTISLAYNSQSVNGMAGYGWNIGGISVISRIPSTKFHDGTIDAVDFDNLDRFALDGQRLLIKSGTNGLYGANGTVYETEVFSNLKITSYGVHPSGANYGPAYFVVEYPDGSVAQYGSSFSSRTIMDYAITYWQNPQGIKINYGYDNNNNNLTITNINYGSNSSAVNNITFVYTSRLRPIQYYKGDKSIIINTILKEIKISSNSLGFRNYELTHDTRALDYERLISIVEKSGDGTKSLNPTVFTYDTTPKTITYSPEPTTISFTNVGSDNAATVSGDFNGDGKMDFLLYPTIGPDTNKVFYLFTDINGQSTNMGWKVPISRFEELFATTWLTSANKLAPIQGIMAIQEVSTNHSNVNFNTYYQAPYGVYTQYSINVMFPTNNPKKYLNGDFNGDGLTDVMVLDKGSSKKTYFVNLDRFKTSNMNYAGDLIDAILDPYNLQTADVDGDGKTDILHFTNGKVNVYSLSDTNQLILLWTYSDTNISVDASKTILLGDYNGDGKIDFITPKGQTSQEWYKYTSTGIKFIKETQIYSGLPYTLNNPYSNFSYIPTDYNNDGKTDLIKIVTSRANNTGSISVICLINKNGTFEQSQINSYSQNSGDQSEINKLAIPIFYSSKEPNSKIEIAFINNNRIHYFQSQKDFNEDRLLKTITTGRGVTESIFYSPLVSSLNGDNFDAIYENSQNTETYPNTDIIATPTFDVVSKIEKESSTVYKRQLFKYYGAVVNTEGLGFLGFRGVMRTNWHDDNNQVISEIAKSDISLRGANIENFTVLGLANPSYTISSSNNFITRSMITYNNTIEPILLSNKVFKLKNILSKNYNGLNGINVETASIYDNYRNPTQTTTTIKNGNTSEKITIERIVYDNQPTASTYYIGRPTSKTQNITIYPGQSNQDNRNTEELYSYNNHLLSEIKKKENASNYITVTNEYNSFGNLIKKTISSPTLIPRVTSYEYDPSERFLIKSTDIEGLTTQFKYNFNNGVLNSEINPFNLETKYYYDVWRKKTRTTDYLGKNAYQSYTNASNPQYIVITKTAEDGSSSLLTLDDLDREIIAGIKRIDGSWSYVSTTYDIYDRKIKISEPFANLTTGGSQFTTNTFDVYGRPIQSITHTNKTTDIKYVDLTTTVSDGIKTMITIQNSIGNTISMTDNGGTINYTHFANNNIKQSDYQGIKIDIEQDVWGRKSKLIDPSAGTYTYTYNDLGEMLTEGTPKGITTYTLDSFGKLISKSIVGVTPAEKTNITSTYSYDSTTKLVNSIAVTNPYDGDSSYTYTYYPNSKKINKTVETLPLASFTKTFNYDAFGRIDTEISIASAFGKSSSKTIKKEYKNGELWKMTDVDTNQEISKINTVNSRGKITNSTMGNNGIIDATYTYDSYGYVSQIKHVKSSSSPSNIMTLNTNFEAKTGNLRSRYNSLFNQTEQFGYDNIDRLTTINKAEVIEVSDFRTSLQGFIYTGEAGGYAILDNEKQKVKALQALSGTRKLIYVNAPQGDTLRISADVIKSLGNGKINAVIREFQSGTQTLIKQTELGTVGYGNFSYEYIVSQTSDISLAFEIDKKPLLDPITHIISLLLPTTFTVDNIVFSRMVVQRQDYDNRGRITKNDLGDYNYSNSLNYRQTSVTPLTATANSYYSTKPLQTISYNAFKNPISIEEQGIEKIDFEYNNMLQRSTMYYGSTDTDKLQRPYRKYYSGDGGMEIKYTKATGGYPEIVEFITYLGGDAYTAPVVVKKIDNGSYNTYYLHRDYQGSILAITNNTGVLLEKRLFDAWGNINQIQDGSGNSLSKLTFFDRGYTGHEHLQGVSLIHMNGRLYDAKLHRFLSPDNNIQEPFNTQSYNRYGYCINNPLKYTDLSGENFWRDVRNGFSNTFKSLAKVVTTVVIIAVSAVVIVASIAIGTTVGLGQFIGSGFQNSSILNNEFRILGGMFQGNISQIASRFTKELPQTLAGLAVSLWANGIGRVKSVSYYGGATVVEHYRGGWGAYTLGSYIMGENGIHADLTNSLFKHEYGHYLQSQDVGWDYLYDYAIPSLINAINVPDDHDGHLQHEAFYTEQDANIRARDYFGSDTWNYDEHPIFDSGFNNYFDLNYRQYYHP